jgi:DNA (cytosine-5)-methyltransferase 1
MAEKAEKFDFKFIDLFAGIGGFHIAMHNLGGKCVFASEMDSPARITYEHNFKKISPELFKNKMFNDDIRNITPSDIPDFDVLCAGFPCQPFSQAGHKRGFDDNHSSERGNLFFNIAEIIAEKRPKAFFLENVRGIVNHDNGNTFKVIRDILEKELGYSFYFKVVKATDYGLPQHRPRAFMIGFKDEGLFRTFEFPEKTPLKFNMSDVWGGDCSRKIGFTLRVGGRGSSINDRRNWDSYLVDGQVRQLGPDQGRIMQGFPEDYEFPVAKTQAIKQLGNSVAIDAVEAVGRQMLKYLFTFINPEQIKESSNMNDRNNKGEWTELLVFLKLLAEQRLFLSDVNLNPKTDFFKINRVTTHNLNLDFLIVNHKNVNAVNKLTGSSKSINIGDLLSKEVLTDLTQIIVKGKKTFSIPEFNVVQDKLGFTVVKGGNSNQKADILLDIENTDFKKEDEGFGIKSYLGSAPTLLNASGNTNFIFEIVGFDGSRIDEVNKIKTRTKLVDRIQFIEAMGGSFKYIGAEKTTMNHNLKMVDSMMPDIIGYVLLNFFSKRINKVSEIVDNIHRNGHLNNDIDYGDKVILEAKIKNLLVAILLGFFAGTKWDGEYISNGTIVMKDTGNMVGFHITDLKSLKDYLYANIKMDTPSSTRHRFGKIYKEKSGKLYFKLNLQLRF